MKIIFAGTPEISAITLQSLINNGFVPSLVLTQPDRPSGRGMKLTASAVKELALKNNIEVYQPISFKKDPIALEKIREVAPDIIIVLAYGLIVPQEFLDIPKLGCVNIHVSLLPKWRGAAPIQRAILAGETTTGITIMQMDVGLDTGDILLQQEFAIDENETSASLHDKMAQAGASLIIEYLNNYQKLTPVKQQEQNVSYAHKLTKEEAEINWTESAELICRKIRGYNSFPVAYTSLNGVLHKIYQAKIVSVPVKQSAANGEIIAINKDGLLVKVADNQAICITELQEAGSKRKTADVYAHGKQNLIGNVFK